MTNTNNNQSAGFISSAVKVAKKLSSTGLDMLNQATPVVPLSRMDRQIRIRLLKALLV